MYKPREINMFLITQDIWMRQKEKVMGMITSAEVICVRKVLYVYTKYSILSIYIYIEEGSIQKERPMSSLLFGG